MLSVPTAAIGAFSATVALPRTVLIVSPFSVTESARSRANNQVGIMMGARSRVDRDCVVPVAAARGNVGRIDGQLANIPDGNSLEAERAGGRLARARDAQRRRRSARKEIESIRDVHRIVAARKINAEMRQVADINGFQPGEANGRAVDGDGSIAVARGVRLLPAVLSAGASDD